LSGSAPTEPAAPRRAVELFSDAIWGLALAVLLILVLLFMGSEDRGFIYVDF